MERPVIPNFTITEYCGSGSSSDVWIGIDENGVARAIKLMDRSSAEKSQLIEREIKSIAEYRHIVNRHAHLLHILYFGATEQYFYFVLDLADNASPSPQTYRPDTLALRLKSRTFPMPEILDTAIAIAEAAQFLHEPHGIGHCDIKPGNILYVDGELQLADPGLTSPLKHESLSGTAGFRPPWKCTAAESDIYAIGKIIYSMYSGRDADAFPSLPPGIDFGRVRRLNDIVCRCCESTASLRYQSLRELLTDLRKLRELRSWPERLYRDRYKIAVWLLLPLLLLSLALCRHLYRTREAGILSRSRSYELLSKANGLYDRNQVDEAFEMLQKIRHHYPAHEELEGFNHLYHRAARDYYWRKSFGANTADNLALLPLFDRISIFSREEKRKLFERTMLIHPEVKESPAFLYHYLKAAPPEDRKLAADILGNLLKIDVDPGGMLSKQLYLIMIANHFTDLGELDRALRYADAACEISFGDQVKYLMRAHIRIRRQEYAEAVEDLRLARKFRPDSPYLDHLMQRIPEAERISAAMAEGKK